MYIRKPRHDALDANNKNALGCILIPEEAELDRIIVSLREHPLELPENREMISLKNQGWNIDPCPCPLRHSAEHTPLALSSLDSVFLGARQACCWLTPRNVRQLPLLLAGARVALAYL